jgi:hypothetical protein
MGQRRLIGKQVRRYRRNIEDRGDRGTIEDRGTRRDIGKWQRGLTETWRCCREEEG